VKPSSSCSTARRRGGGLIALIAALDSGRAEHPIDVVYDG